MMHSDFLKLEEGDIVYMSGGACFLGTVVKVGKYNSSELGLRDVDASRVITEVTLEQRDGKRYTVSDLYHGYENIENLLDLL